MRGVTIRRVDCAGLRTWAESVDGICAGLQTAMDKLTVSAAAFALWRSQAASTSRLPCRAASWSTTSRARASGGVSPRRVHGSRQLGSAGAGVRATIPRRALRHPAVRRIAPRRRRPTACPTICCRLLDHLKIARAHLVGHSFGGGVALDFALLHPDRVASLMLAAAGRAASSAPKTNARRRAPSSRRSRTATRRSSTRGWSIRCGPCRSTRPECCKALEAQHAAQPRRRSSMHVRAVCSGHAAGRRAPRRDQGADARARRRSRHAGQSTGVRPARASRSQARTLKVIAGADHAPAARLVARVQRRRARLSSPRRADRPSALPAACGRRRTARSRARGPASPMPSRERAILQQPHDRAGELARRRRAATSRPVSPSTTASGNAAGARADHRQPHRHRVEHGRAEAFGDRAHHEEIGGLHQLQDVLAEPGEQHVLLEAQLLDLAFERRRAARLRRR